MHYRKKIPKPFLDRFFSQKNGHSSDDFVDIIIRDIEALLNTRSTEISQELGGTVLAYGVPDMTTTGKSEAEFWGLALKVRKALEDFEPRLSNIVVEPVPCKDSDIDHFTVKIIATLVGFEDRPPLNLEMPVPYHQGHLGI